MSSIYGNKTFNHGSHPQLRRQKSTIEMLTPATRIRDRKLLQRQLTVDATPMISLSKQSSVHPSNVALTISNNNNSDSNESYSKLSTWKLTNNGNSFMNAGSGNGDDQCLDGGSVGGTVNGGVGSSILMNTMSSNAVAGIGTGFVSSKLKKRSQGINKNE